MLSKKLYRVWSTWHTTEFPSVTGVFAATFGQAQNSPTRPDNHPILHIPVLTTFSSSKTKFHWKKPRFQDVQEVQQNATRQLLAIFKRRLPGMLPGKKTTLGKMCCIRMGLQRSGELVCFVLFFLYHEPRWDQNSYSNKKKYIYLEKTSSEKSETILKKCLCKFRIFPSFTWNENVRNFILGKIERDKFCRCNC